MIKSITKTQVKLSLGIRVIANEEMSIAILLFVCLWKFEKNDIQVQK